MLAVTATALESRVIALGRLSRAAAAHPRPEARGRVTRHARACHGHLAARLAILEEQCLGGNQRAASACKVGDRGADRATAADHDALARAHTATEPSLASRFQAALIERRGPQRILTTYVIAVIIVMAVVIGIRSFVRGYGDALTGLGPRRFAGARHCFRLERVDFSPAAPRIYVD